MNTNPRDVMRDEGIQGLGNQDGSDLNADPLEDSPIPKQILGNAFPAMAMFHVKLRKEGIDRGIIGPRDSSCLWERHILNCAAIVPFVSQVTKELGVHTVADVGSGGGFPGLVLAACLPDCDFTLIEPMERRVEWLQECINELDLRNVTILRDRAENIIAARKRHDISDYGMVPASGYAVVTCRAVAPMTRLAGWTIPLLMTHGRLIALKGRSAQAEVEKAWKSIVKAGGCDPHVLEAPVGADLESTHVVVIRRR